MGLYRDSCGLVGDPTLSKLLLRQGLYRLYNSHNVLQAWESPTGEAPFISDTNITKRMGPALHRTPTNPTRDCEKCVKFSLCNEPRSLIIW